MNSKYREEKYRPPYYLLTGIILGLILGFGVTFAIFPVQYSNVPPETLQAVDKDQYRLMIAYAYQANHDLGRANARLGLLREEDLAALLLNQAQRSERRSDAQILLSLSEALQTPANPTESQEQAVEAQTATAQVSSESPQPGESATAGVETIRTATAQPTIQQQIRTPFPTQTTIPSSTIPFRLVEQEIVCNSNFKKPYIQVIAVDKENNAMPNVRIMVSWEGGQDIFYTGYYPEISAGYADYEMDPALSYSIQIGEIGEVLEQLSAPECKDDFGNAYWGSISLLFSEP
jgi:hypothetical protein